MPSDEVGSTGEHAPVHQFGPGLVQRQGNKLRDVTARDDDFAGAKPRMRLELVIAPHADPDGGVDSRDRQPTPGRQGLHETIASPRNISGHASDRTRYPSDKKRRAFRIGRHCFGKAGAGRRSDEIMG